MKTSPIVPGGGTMLQQTPLNLSIFAVYVVIVGLAALFPIAAHTRHDVVGCLAYVVVVLLPLGFLLFRTQSPRLQRILSHPVFWIAVLAFLGWYDETRYLAGIFPHPEKNTAAPALMFTAQNILRGQDPYAIQLAQHSPVSPGPGWILLLAPITLAKGAGLLTCIGASIVSLLLACYGRLSAGVFLLLTLFEFELVWTSFWGTDLFLISFAFAALCLLADRYSANAAAMTLLGCGAGLVAQSRLPMAVLPLIVGVGLWRRNRRNALYFGTAAVLVAAAFYLFFYAWTVRDHLYFQPLHLLHRERRSGLFASIVGPLGGGLTLVWVLFRMRGQVRDWLLAGAALFLLLFVPTGLGELALTHDPANWEAANYVSLGLPLLAAYLALAVSGKQAEAAGNS